MGASRLTPFAIDALRSEPWRNGAGWTRTVCVHAVEDQVLWRVSVADITAAGQFSQFAGMDRTAVMVQGGQLRLSNADVQLDFDGLGSQLQFPGEWSLHCAEPEGPTQLLNIMVRRGQASARVEVVKNKALTLTPGGQQLVLVLRGSFQLRSSAGTSHTLQARTGLHWQRLEEDWRAEPLGADAVMAWCALSG
jgi:environmental stress-induced protein Ves